MDDVSHFGWEHHCRCLAPKFFLEELGKKTQRNLNFFIIASLFVITLSSIFNKKPSSSTIISVFWVPCDKPSTIKVLTGCNLPFTLTSLEGLQVISSLIILYVFSEISILFEPANPSNLEARFTPLPRTV